MSDYTLPKSLLKPDSDAQGQLKQNVRVLHLLHHRSKNQHGRSPWYCHFNKFRTELKTLCGDLQIDSGPGLHTANSTSDSEVKRRKLSTTTPSSLAGKAAQQKATTRLSHWITSGFVLRCYTAFSSLAATPSFSPLALTLIAILARVCSVTSITAHMKSLSRLEADKIADEEEEQVSDALMRFAEEDAGELFDRVEDGKELDDREHGTAVERGTTLKMSASKSTKRRKKANAIDDLFAGL